MGDVYVNGRKLVHKGDGGTFVAISPDVCKTPSPGGPIPIPYPNIARSADLDKATKDIKIEGQVAAVEGAVIKSSTGDEAGTAGGGIISAKTKGKMGWVLWSPDVTFEGKGVVRFLDPTLHNGNGFNDHGMTPGSNYIQADLIEKNREKQSCGWCGGDLNDDVHKNLEIKADKKLAKQAKSKLKYSTKKNGGEARCGIAQVKCKVHGTIRVVLDGEVGGSFPKDGILPNLRQGSNGNSRSKKASRNWLDKVAKGGRDRNGVGQCIEQNLLTSVLTAFKKQNGEGARLGGCCEVTMAVAGTKLKSKKDNVVAPCDTCREVLPAMLCPNEPKSLS